jgi:hypothetical protein
MNNTPNLFQWATSELSQDAFLCWLIDWTHPAYKGINPLLSKSAKAFIDLMTESKIHSIETLSIERQYKNIDIVVLINGIHVILIEDKVHSKEHGNQLSRYKNLLEDKYLDKKIHPVYLKTGDQSNYKRAKDNGYKIIRRIDLLEVLEDGIKSGIKNHIYIDFTNFLKRRENAVLSYLRLPFEDWQWDSWKGFYQDVQKRFNDGTWDYVPQKNGGFLGYWWHWNSAKFDDIYFEYYLQLEHTKLCIKIYVEGTKENKYNVRNQFRQKLYPLAKKHQIDIYQNGSIGKWMTVAALSNEYRVKDKSNFIDMKATIDNLKRINNLIDAINFG